jgi:hypothetical protein
MNIALTNVGALAQVQHISSGWFSDMDTTYRFVITLAIIVCLTIIMISIFALVTTLFSSLHRERAQAELKREMLDRGLSAEEIAQVIESRTPESFLDRWASNRGKGEAKKTT